ncbi:MAG TPA: hypothetical protein VFX39_03855, partial [Gemmatimonadaceae bacterium]|nr:hypothetical protein [Gemmatimonadaceae bacterium]
MNPSRSLIPLLLAAITASPLAAQSPTTARATARAAAPTATAPATTAPATERAAAIAASRFEFTIPNMMRGPEVYGREPQEVRWTPDSRWIYFQWLPPGSDWREPLATYRVRATPGATPERVTPAHMDSVGPLLA